MTRKYPTELTPLIAHLKSYLEWEHRQQSDSFGGNCSHGLKTSEAGLGEFTADIQKNPSLYNLWISYKSRMLPSVMQPGDCILVAVSASARDAMLLKTNPTKGLYRWSNAFYLL